MKRKTKLEKILAPVEKHLDAIRKDNSRERRDSIDRVVQCVVNGNFQGAVQIAEEYGYHPDVAFHLGKEKLQSSFREYMKRVCPQSY